MHRLVPFALISCFLAVASTTAADSMDTRLYDALRWRMIGPFRGGRTVGATGVPGKPNLFYIGVNNGGVWRSTDYGRVWTPIFDDQPTGSIGALAVAPSNPNVIYVGSGEGLQRPDLSTGDGIFKSTDAGKTWEHLGLRDGWQIGALLVDPHDENRVFAAVLGHPYGANAERGVFRSTDGGKTWRKVLYKDENTGAIALAFDPSSSKVVYADLWSARQGPWENGAWQGSGSGLFRSTDGGDTWKQLTNGLPTFKQGLGRIGFAIAPSDSRRMFATVDCPQLGGVYRSDDAGETWTRTNAEPRLWGRGSDFAEVRVHPKNPNIVYVANTSTYRSADGGKTFTAIRGAPGGDDYHTIWINPSDPEIILLAGDQGALVTVNGGDTWSSWYNQPTAQFYHVAADDRFPYWVYGGQQESGSAAVCSRGNDGQITFREWRPVGVEEYGYVAPDPLHPNLTYGGKASCYDWNTGQTRDVSPEAIRSGKYRFLRTAPLLFSPVDPHALYLGANVVFKTRDGGQNWNIISPDLSRVKPEVPASVGVYRTPELAEQPRRGVIYTVAPSYKNVNVLWAGTDDGLIHVTSDGGKKWRDVTPPTVDAWSKVSIIDAGRFDQRTAYAAVNRIRLDDQRPHIFRTHDEGKTWREIVHGLPTDAPVNVVREDRERPGLLFAGTERAVFVSFNDGDDWSPLRLNMPATSIRDLIVHGDDLVVGTHGRSFWILDDVTPLRQLQPNIALEDSWLFTPQRAVRVRWNMNTDTPLPQEEPAGKNPPDGAILHYFLKEAIKEPVSLEITDEHGALVRRYSSGDKDEAIAERELAIPRYWIRPPQPLSTAAGSHRFIWDLRYAPPPGVAKSYPISAVYADTPAEPRGPFVLPGEYSVTLTVGGRKKNAKFRVEMDPRVSTPLRDLFEQLRWSMNACDGLRKIDTAMKEIHDFRAALNRVKTRAKAPPPKVIEIDDKAAMLQGEANRGSPRREGAAGKVDLSSLRGDLARLLGVLQEADVAPTRQLAAACEERLQLLARSLAHWEEIKRERP